MKQYLQYNWWKYLAILLIPIILWCGIFDILQKPAAHQRMRILYVGENLDTAALQQKLSDTLPTLTEQPLREILIKNEQYCDNTTLTARCFEYDLIVIEESCLPEKVGQRVFGELTPELLSLFSAAPFYEETVENAEKNFGFLLEPGEKTNFSAFYSSNNTCYLFFSPESVNCNPSGNDAALKAAYYLMEPIL